jgi:transglutaminase-like putative cysteine protease
MFYAIRHLTRYRYNRPVWQSMMEVRMHPLSEAYQRCFTFRLQVNPRARIFVFQDHLGNQVHHFDLPQHHRELSIVADSLVNLEPMPAVPEALPGGAWQDLERLIAQGDHWQMLMPSHFARTSPLLEELTREIGVEQADGRDPLTLVHAVSGGIHRAFAYVRKSTAVNSPIEACLSSRQGVCQDFAHVMIGGLRAIGLAARYVSGYLLTRPPPGRPRLVGADASHAWVSVWCPHRDGESTWLDLDPTNDVIPSTSHVTLAVGRDFGDVSPLRGIIRGGGDHKLSVGVTVRPVDEPGQRPGSAPR